MPFAMIGFFLGFTEELIPFPFVTFILVLLCMIFARNAAMAFNRWLDSDIDAKNIRTVQREIPAGIISSNSALIFVIANSLFFIVAAYFINLLCFYLSPIALLIILGYSYTKRFTALCHLILGLGLSLAPIGAYIAVTGSFHIVPILFGISVLFWVAGFDIIYALQDEEFDRSHQLNSIPVTLGRNKSMILSNILHVISASVLISAVYFLNENWEKTGYLSGLGVVVFICLLVYQHSIIKPQDLSRVDISFFTTNGIASVFFGILVISDLLF
jgi:4-hydroxybenzoate polyprenyltransferase